MRARFTAVYSSKTALMDVLRYKRSQRETDRIGEEEYNCIYYRLGLCQCALEKIESGCISSDVNSSTYAETPTTNPTSG